MAFEEIGQPIGDEVALSAWHVRFHEKAMVLRVDANTLVVSYALPMVGRPNIATGNAEAFPVGLTFEKNAWPFADVAKAVKEAVAGRLFVAPTGQPSVLLPLEAGNLVEVDHQHFGIALRAANLEDRCLYDVVVDVAGARQRVAPHALYHRKSWDNFGLAHITDMHVARRIDSFRRLLREANRPEAADRMYNWNDRFRGFVRYANWLHSQGILDVIIATGDLYDFLYEEDDDPKGTGNAAWLRKLILGEAPGPDFPDVEELRVPIFLTPGNHDYRLHPYKLRFQLPVGDWIASYLGIAATYLLHDRATIPFDNYSGYHLGKTDAEIITNRLTNQSTEGIQNETASGAGRMVQFTDNLWQYAKTLAPLGPYVVELGPHRIAMIDSAHDEGVVGKVLDLLRVKLQGGSEDEATFVGGSPNCVGVTDEAYRFVTQALDATPDHGLFFAGLHAPLFNMWGNEYPYFLRQSQRPFDRDAKQAVAFLARHLLDPSITPANLPIDDAVRRIETVVRERYPHWFPAERDHRPPAFVSRDRSAYAGPDDGHDPLEFGVSRHRADALMERFVGDGTKRAADVVFAGHTHRHNEFSVRRTHTGEIAYYMDFFTENPTSYYATRFTTGWQSNKHPQLHSVLPTTDVTLVEVVDGAAADGVPHPLSGSERFQYAINVPPYATPLANAADPKTWWSEHRPLVLQTGALGPLDTDSVSFSGFRVATVRDNVIQKIHFVSTERLERAGFRLSWEEAIAPAPRWQHEAAGQLVFYRDAHRDGTGDVNTPSVIGLGGWQHLTQLSSGGGGTIYAVNKQGQLLFYKDTTQDGTTHVDGPHVIGLGGWQSMLHVVAGGDGILYAVDRNGQLLFYCDARRDGTGDVNSPSVIGRGGWQYMTRLFSGGGGILYAVDRDGRLLRYRDRTRNGTGDVSSPVLLGIGAWGTFLQLFSGGDGTIYAVNDAGQLLFFKDSLSDAPTDIGSPRVIGLGGWQHFHAVFAGENGIIYAARAQAREEIPPQPGGGGEVRFTATRVGRFIQ